MRRGDKRILTTHTGSLPTPPEMAELMLARDEGQSVGACGAEWSEAVPAGSPGFSGPEKSPWVGSGNALLPEITCSIAHSVLHWQNDRQTTYLLAPILNILVLHTVQVPSVAGRPFFIVMGFAFAISRCALHFMQ